MSDDSGSFHHNYEDVVKFRSGKPPGDGYEPSDRPFGKDAYDEPSISQTRSSRGSDYDSYEPSRYGARDYAARDGYAPDAASDGYGRQSGARGRNYPAPVVTYRGSERRRSYDDNDVDDYEERTRVQKYRRDSDRGSDRARSHSQKRSERSSSRKRRGSDSSGEGRHGDGNDELKKWGATIAGAAVGGFTAHKAKGGKGGENWVPAAIGAVIGGLVGREVEKQVYKRKDHHREEEEKY